MSEQKHSSEPWHLVGGSVIGDASGICVSSIQTQYGYHCEPTDTLNAARIVACVNFCAGLPISFMVATGKTSIRPDYKAQCAQWNKTIDDLRAELAKAVKERDAARKQAELYRQETHRWSDSEKKRMSRTL